MEYLLTYGWALVLIATIIGVLVLIVGTPGESPVFNSSEPTKLPIKGGTIDTATPPNASVIVKNATGGALKVTGFTLSGQFSESVSPNDSTLNNARHSTITAANPLPVIAGGDLKFASIIYTSPGSGTIAVEYTDVYGFGRTLTITGRKGKG